MQVEIIISESDCAYAGIEKKQNDAGKWCLILVNGNSRQTLTLNNCISEPVLERSHGERAIVTYDIGEPL